MVSHPRWTRWFYDLLSQLLLIFQEYWEAFMMVIWRDHQTSVCRLHSLKSPECTPSAQNTYFSVNCALKRTYKWAKGRLFRRRRNFSWPNWSMSVIYLDLIYHIPLALVPHLSDWLVSNDFGWINAGHHIVVHAESGDHCWQLLNVGISLVLSTTWFLAMLLYTVVTLYSVLFQDIYWCRSVQPL